MGVCGVGSVAGKRQVQKFKQERLVEKKTRKQEMTPSCYILHGKVGAVLHTCIIMFPQASPRLTKKSDRRLLH
jgi:hypothetical protein